MKSNIFVANKEDSIICKKLNKEVVPDEGNLLFLGLGKV
jgi:hypothetical protein